MHWVATTQLTQLFNVSTKEELLIRFKAEIDVVYDTVVDVTEPLSDISCHMALIIRGIYIMNLKNIKSHWKAISLVGIGVLSYFEALQEYNNAMFALLMGVMTPVMIVIMCLLMYVAWRSLLTMISSNPKSDKKKAPTLPPAAKNFADELMYLIESVDNPRINFQDNLISFVLDGQDLYGDFSAFVKSTNFSAEKLVILATVGGNPCEITVYEPTSAVINDNSVTIGSSDQEIYELFLAIKKIEKIIRTDVDLPMEVVARARSIANNARMMAYVLNNGADVK